MLLAGRYSVHRCRSVFQVARGGNVVHTSVRVARALGVRKLRLGWVSGAVGGVCRSMATDDARLMEGVLKCVPPLTGSNYKGQHGKVGVVGGSQEYTGAPYFAAISALKVGADLAYVFCTKEAGPVIKGYSPELIVLPWLPHSTPEAATPELGTSDTFASQLQEWLPRVSALVVGPGLGSDVVAVAAAEMMLTEARKRDVLCVVDGSAITHLVAHKPELVKGYANCILTPNIAELGRLANAVGVELEGQIGSHWQQHAQDIAQRFEGPVLVSKGSCDIVTNGSLTITCSQDSSPRRAGGQGDVLAGSIATFMCWTNSYHKANPDNPLALAADGTPYPQSMVAAYAGCMLTRAASKAAFKDLGRSMLAGNIILHLGQSLERAIVMAKT